MKTMVVIVLMLILGFSTYPNQEIIDISGRWVRSENYYDSLLFDTLRVEGELEPPYQETYTISTYSGIFEHIYHYEKLQRILPSTHVEIVDFEFLEEDKGRVYFYSHTTERKVWTEDRQGATYDEFQLEGRSITIIMRRQNLIDTLELQILNKNQIRFYNDILTRHD